MKKKLYVMRHGQTQNNVDNICQGSGDSALTAKGIEELKLMQKKWLSTHEVDHFYSSPIGRARKSLEIFAGCEYEVVEGLRERFQGDREGKKFVELKEGEDYAVLYHAELKEDFRKRVMKTMKDIMEKENSNVLVMTHGALCSHFRNCVLNEDVGSWIDNASIFEYEWEDGIFRYIREYKVNE